MRMRCWEHNEGEQHVEKVLVVFAAYGVSPALALESAIQRAVVSR